VVRSIAWPKATTVTCVWRTADLCRKISNSPHTGRRDEAQAMFAEIYGCFTEDFDTRDLNDANALLSEFRSD